MIVKRQRSNARASWFSIRYLSVLARPQSDIAAYLVRPALSVTLDLSLGRSRQDGERCSVGPNLNLQSCLYTEGNR